MRASVDYIQSEKGYILLEIAIVILVAGLLIGTASPMYRIYVERNAVNVTKNNIEALERAFSNYVQMRWRLPCPADPAVASGNQFGVERAMPCNTPVLSRGIVPYRTLGVPEDFAKDGYGNFFTYMVSPDFTADTRIGIAANTVNERLAHLVAANNFALLPIAQFCAPLANSGTDIDAQQDGASLYSTVAARDATNVGRPAVTPSANIKRENTVTAVSMAIISHGSNGTGAYLASGAQRAGAAGTAEAATNNETNPTRNILQMSSDFSTTGADEYDDIVKFYTQDEIYAVSGGGSCEHL